MDDDEFFLRSVARLLRSHGYPVQTFGSGREFLDAGIINKPQCLVLDVHMPGMGGPELHQELLARGCDFPVVFVTADVTPQTLQHMRDRGCRLLLKPFDQDILSAAIRNAIERVSPKAPRGQTGAGARA